MDEPTLGEVNRRLASVAEQISKLATAIEALQAAIAITYVRQDVYRAEKEVLVNILKNERAAVELLEKSITEQIESLEEWKDWSLKIIVGAVILAVLALIFSGVGGLSPP